MRIEFKNLSICLLFCLLVGCTSDQQVETAKGSLLNIIVFDQSKSFNYAQIDMLELSKMLYTDALKHQVWVAGIAISNTTSMEQEVIFSDLPTLDTLNLEQYSIYQFKKVQEYNKQIQANFYKSLSSLSGELENLFRVRDNPLSDVNGALKLAKRLAEQEIFMDAEVRLIILSDLVHDQDDLERTGEFVFPANTTIYPIYHNDKKEINTVFPQNEIEFLAGLKSIFFNDKTISHAR